MYIAYQDHRRTPNLSCDDNNDDPFETQRIDDSTMVMVVGNECNCNIHSLYLFYNCSVAIGLSSIEPKSVKTDEDETEVRNRCSSRIGQVAVQTVDLSSCRIAPTSNKR